MSGILDLAQMKWCHIRSIESVQEVEKSNIGFKRIVLGEPMPPTIYYSCLCNDSTFMDMLNASINTFQHIF